MGSIDKFSARNTCIRDSNNDAWHNKSVCFYYQSLVGKTIMEIITSFLSLAKGLPASASVLLSFVAIGIAFFLQRKKINIEETTSISTTQQKQIDSLMTQIELLSDELEKTRQQLTELHNQNIELMKQLREANHRISELEMLLDTTSRINEIESRINKATS